jgi:tRNA(Ile)-lysidine synthase
MHLTISSAALTPSARSLDVDSGFEFPSDFQTDRRDSLIEIDRLMASVGLTSSDKHIAVAVSGGSDSMALALLAGEWGRTQGVRVTALTVDHGLRAESSAEARQVGDWLANYGVAHYVLRWQGDKPATGVQAAARDARYGLMTDWCRANGVAKLLLAHQLEDQAETFLFRLARGSGPDGLACMMPVVRRGGVILVRPLLNVARQELRQYLTDRGQDWIDDPSNEDPAFTRTGLGRLSRNLSNHGVPPERLAALAESFAKVRLATDQVVTAAMDRFVTVYPAGYATCSPKTFERLPREVGRALLRRLLRLIGGKAYAASNTKLDRAMVKLRRSASCRGLTLGGCVVQPGPSGVLIYREAPTSASETITIGREMIWHGVFRCRLTGAAIANNTPPVVRALGEAGWREIVKVAPALRLSDVPYPVRLTLPALSISGTICAVPHLDFAENPDKGGSPEAFKPNFEANFVNLEDR